MIIVSIVALSLEPVNGKALKDGNYFIFDVYVFQTSVVVCKGSFAEDD